MEVVKGRNSIRKVSKSPQSSTIQVEEDMGDLRRGPWTGEEDFKLASYISSHGEGRWNSLARCAGLKRTGKSCRLRWLNYLRPDVRRGNITLEEQLMILELHSRWGNRWSKIAQHLPGRTDNEIKNYWRTRVQKHAKQLKCDVNSKQFKDAVRYLWMPRLMERIQAAANASSSSLASTTTTSNITATLTAANYPSFCGNTSTINNNSTSGVVCGNNNNNNLSMMSSTPQGVIIGNDFGYTPDNSSTTAASSDSFGTHVSPISDFTNDCYNNNINIAINQTHHNNPNFFQASQVGYSDSITSPHPVYFNQGLDHNFQATDQNNQWWDTSSENFWNVEDIWFLHQQQQQPLLSSSM